MSMESPRLPAVLGSVLIGAGALAGLTIGGRPGVVVLVATGQLVLVGLVLVAWRDLRRTHRRLRADVRAVKTRLDAGVAELQTAADQNAQQTAESVRSELAAFGKAQANQASQVRNAFRKQFQQIEALAALYYGMRPTDSIPPTRSWSASPDLLRYLFETVRDGPQRLVLECGSGVSTLVFAYAFRARGTGQVVALEHDQHYAEITRKLIDSHDLASWAEVRFAPLKPVQLEDESWPWYDLSEVPPGPIDLLLVDGPPGATRERARFPAVPLLYDRLAPGAMVVLDDHHRDDEQAVARLWRERYPDLVAEPVRHEKGTMVLRRPASPAPPR